MQRDKEIKCKRCDVIFIFSIKEQNFYEKQGFLHTPKRCPNCRDLEKLENITCPSCGEEVGYGVIECKYCNKIIGRCPHCNSRSEFMKVFVHDPYHDGELLSKIGTNGLEILARMFARMGHSPNYRGRTDTDKYYDALHRQIEIKKYYLFECNSCSKLVFINSDKRILRPWR
jgi:hypothetical protein